MNPRQAHRDELYKFKRGVSLTKPYEVYLETEKAYMTHQKESEKKRDPMEILATKIHRGQPLDFSDHKQWVSYNFLALKDEDQAQVKQLNERQQWFWRRMSVLIPPFWCFAFAIYKHQLKFRVVTNFFASCATVGALCQIGLYSSNRDMSLYYQRLYDDNKDDVIDPRHRGKKLFDGKKRYQIDNEDFTSSNFDDLKRKLFNQKSK